MKLKFQFYLFLISVVSLLGSCAAEEEEDTSTIGDWVRTTPFKGKPRSGAIAFSIGSSAYVGLGYDGDEYVNDFYEYDVDKGFWEQRKSFPGELRERAIAFSIDGKGYVGLGYNRDRDTEELGDLWVYDPAADQWNQVSDFEGSPRYNAVSFVIGAKAYVGTGYDGDQYNSDFWEYDPVADDWSEIESYPGDKIESGISFVIDDKAYVCSGRNNDTYNVDFWSYNPGDELWTKLTPDSDETYYDEFKSAVFRHDAVAFATGGKAYIVGGIASSGATDRSVYEFNPSNQQWADRTSFEGAARSSAVAFVLNENVFLGTGLNGTRTYDDVWQFYPGRKYDDEF